ncbi:hypothetical protein HanXRQr2_Chr13g0570931 [Helianthus annuus]|uniref:Uncharacterized protein n=1 Tax=Helianthus annuus TaxID=4232 RepID=A0A9K3EF02_HELAN|nr:hypothetical protein HanXRQr2_Chr13g0570931 [Helianthus annuus]KAJ0847810.1 hypothetical protein HanPSC8_Chr13g0549631 [Helianthus annuus]
MLKSMAARRRCLLAGRGGGGAGCGGGNTFTRRAHGECGGRHLHVTKWW